MLKKHQKIKISYNALGDEIHKDEGVFFEENPDFIVIELSDKKLKYISKNKIVRIEEIEE